MRSSAGGTVIQTKESWNKSKRNGFRESQKASYVERLRDKAKENIAPETILHRAKVDGQDYVVKKTQSGLTIQTLASHQSMARDGLYIGGDDHTVIVQSSRDPNLLHVCHLYLETLGI